MSSFDEILTEWCNCLEISNRISCITELKDGKFLTAIVCSIKNISASKTKNEEEAIQGLICLLENSYKKFSIEWHQKSFSDFSDDDIRFVTSLLLHYTCIQDRRESFTSPLCKKLSKTTQLCIKSFLEMVHGEITLADLASILDNFSEKSENGNNSPNLFSPLTGMFRSSTPPRNEFHDQDKEMVKLKMSLDLERYEKADLQEELKILTEKNKKYEKMLDGRNAEIIRLKREITALECKTPPHFQSSGSTDTVKRLKREIQSLEHYIEKTEKEQDDLRDESYRNKKKLTELGQDLTRLQYNLRESERRNQNLTSLSTEQAAKITSLEKYCEELSGLLEEFRSKSANESSFLETSSVSVRRSFSNLNIEENLAGSVVEVQLKEAIKQNEEMQLKMDTIVQELEQCKNSLCLRNKECEKINLKLKEGMIGVANTKNALQHLRNYFMKELKEYENSVSKLKGVVRYSLENYNVCFKNLTLEKDNNKTLSKKLCETLSTLTKCKETLEDAETKKHEYEKYITELNEQKEDFIFKLSKYKDDNEEYSRIIETLENTITNHKTQIDSLKKDNNDYLSTIHNLTTDCGVLRSENADLSSKLTENRGKIPELLERIECFSRTIEDLKSIEAKMRTENQKLTSDLQMLKDTHEILEDQLRLSETEKSEQMYRVESLSHDLQKIKYELVLLESEKVEFLSKTQNLQNCCELLTIDNKSLTSKIENFNEINVNLKNNKEILEEQIEKLNRTNEELQQEIGKLNATLQNSEERNSNLEEKLQISQQKNEEYLCDVETLNNDLAKRKYELDQFQSEKISNLSTIQDLHSQVGYLNDQNNNLSSQLIVTSQKLSDTSEKVDLLESESEKLRLRMEQLNADNNKIEEILEEKELLIEDLKKSRDEISDQLTISEETNKKYSSEKQSQELKIQDYELKFKLIISDTNETISKLEGLNSEIASKLEITESKNHEYSDKIQNLQNTLQQKIMECDQINSVVASKEDEIISLKRVIEVKCKEYQEIVEENNKCVSEIEELKQDIISTSEEAEKIKFKLVETEKIKTLNSRHYEDSLQDNEKEREKHLSRIKELEELMTEKQTELESFKKEKDRNIEELNEKVSTAQNILDSKNRKVELYINCINSMRIEHGSLKTSIGQIKRFYKKELGEIFNLLVNIQESNETITQNHNAVVEYLQDEIVCEREKCKNLTETLSETRDTLNRCENNIAEIMKEREDCIRDNKVMKRNFEEDILQKEMILNANKDTITNLETNLFSKEVLIEEVSQKYEKLVKENESRNEQFHNITKLLRHDIYNSKAMYQKEMNEYTNYLMKLKDAVKRFEEELNEQNILTQNLREQIETEKESKICLQREIELINEHNVNYQNNILELKKEQNEILEEKKSFQKNFIELVGTLSIYNKQLDKVVKNLKGYNKPTSCELSDVQIAYNQFNKLNELNSPLKTKDSAKPDELEELGGQISRINAYIDVFNEKETFYQKEIEHLKAELAAVNNSYFELTQNLKEQNSDNEFQVTSLTENLHSVIAKYNELQTEHRESLKKISDYESELSFLKRDQTNLNVTHELKVMKLQEDVMKCEENISALKKAREVLIDEHNENLTAFEGRLSKSDDEKEALKVEFEKMEKNYNDKIAELRTNIETHEKAKLAADLALEKYLLQTKKLENEIENKEKEIQLLKKQCEDCESKMMGLEVQISLYKEEMSQLKGKFGRTEEEYETALATLQVQVVGNKLEVTNLEKKNKELLNEKDEVLKKVRELEGEKNKIYEEMKNVEMEFERERKLVEVLRNEITEKDGMLKEMSTLKDIQARYDKLKEETSNLIFLQEKNAEQQQKIETLMNSIEMQKQAYEVFKIYYKHFEQGLDQILSQKNILETLTNTLRVFIVNVCKKVPQDGSNLRKLLEKKETMEIITEDVMKQYNRFSKRINDMVFEVVKYYEKNCDKLLSNADFKIENCLENYDLDELKDQLSDLTDRTTDCLEQVKMLHKDLENLNKVEEDLKIQKENILGASKKINVEKMKEEDLKKKNLALRQKVTLLENAKGNLEKTVKKLREENKKIKEGNNSVPDSDVHYKMLLQEYIAYKEQQEQKLNDYKTKLNNLQLELNGHMRTSTPFGDENLFSATEKQLQTDLANLQEAFVSIRMLNAKLESENQLSKKMLEEHKQEIGKFTMIKEAYDKLLEENNKLMTDVDTMKYKRARDRDEFLRLLKKERGDNESRNSQKVQDIKAEYEAKLERMKEKMIKLYKDEVNKEMSRVKEGQNESSSLQKMLQQLKGELFEAEQKIQLLEMERDILKRSRDQSADFLKSGESVSDVQYHEADTRSLRDFSSIASSTSGKPRAQSNIMEFKHPKKINPSSLDTRRQYDERRVSTLPRTGTVIEEVTVSRRRTSFGVPDSLGPNLQMEDEEELFNNKYLMDLKQGNCDLPPSADRDSRVSELAWRNSLVPPHLKSSYPAEMQFFSPGRFREDDLKTGNLPFEDSLCKLLPGDKPRKKDFGTTSYKKPGPPTPSKNGGRLSLQGNEVHPAREPPAEPKRSTPSRIRALFTGRNSSKSSTESSPPKRRLNIFRR